MPSQTSTPRPFSIAVCGGGLGGLALTVGLLRQGVDVHVYEAAHIFSEIGAGIDFGPSGRQAMALIDPAITAGYDRNATENGWLDKRASWFDFRLGMDLPKQGKPSGQKIMELIAPPLGKSSVHRAHMLDEFVSLVPHEKVDFNKRLEEIEEIDDGVKLIFKDGTVAEASAVIGCDGVKSRTRQVLLGADNPLAHSVFAGMYAYRGLVPMDKAIDAVGDELAKNCQFYLGRSGAMLTYPIDRGATMNVIAWRTVEDGKWGNPWTVLPKTREEIKADFPDWGVEVQAVLNLLDHAEMWAMLDMPATESFYRGRICLMGDAAHASTPFQGAGAGMAMEDAYILSSLLGFVKDTSSLEAAFAAFDHIRRPRTQKLVTTSRTAYEVYSLKSEETGTDLEKIKEDIRDRWTWIWTIDLEEHLADAKKFFDDKTKKL